MLEYRLAAQKECHVGAERREYAGQLDGDVAAADDGDPLRPARQLEEAVGGNPELRARDGRQQGTAAGSEHDVRSAERGARGLHRAAVHEMRPAADQRDAALGEIALVDAVEAQNVGVALLLEEGP